MIKTCINQVIHRGKKKNKKQKKNEKKGSPRAILKLFVAINKHTVFLINIGWLKGNSFLIKNDTKIEFYNGK